MTELEHLQRAHLAISVAHAAMANLRLALSDLDKAGLMYHMVDCEFVTDDELRMVLFAFVRQKYVINEAMASIRARAMEEVTPQ